MLFMAKLKAYRIPKKLNSGGRRFLQHQVLDQFQVEWRARVRRLTRLIGRVAWCHQGLAMLRT